jgi:hypothetical protein
MKYLLVFMAALGLVVGCSTSQSTTAFQTETALDASVTTAWDLWQAFEKGSPQPAATVAKVDAAFQKVQLAEEAVIAASSAVATNSTGGTVDFTAANAAFADLTTLLATFNIKL